MVHQVSCDWAGRPLHLETGRMARLAESAVLVSYGDTVVLVAATITSEPQDLPFLPLRVDFEEKMYAIGDIPGGFFKREGRPGDAAILTCRRTDRPIRTLLPDGLRNDVQVIATPLSADNQNSIDVVTMIGASAAMHLSSLPFAGPFGVAQVGIDDGQFTINPPFEQLEAGDLTLLMSATADGIVMAEVEAKQIPDEMLGEAFAMAEDACQPVVKLIEELRDKAGKPKIDYPMWEPRPGIVDFVEGEYADDLGNAFQIVDKLERQQQVSALKNEVNQRLAENHEDPKLDIDAAVNQITKRLLRDTVLNKKRRLDGREFSEVRPLSCEVGLAPRAHGSGLFTRGETQVLTVTTLGAVRDQQLVRSLEEEEYHRFMHHYNFPP
ncbi:MAG: polyribonucleotide nucleotidyltransferase, partial [Armatimonadetes bacterium]|nr:polyribonucleotide nucleotidyltransferase [Armatimonadota bacterium]